MTRTVESLTESRGPILVLTTFAEFMFYNKKKTNHEVSGGRNRSDNSAIKNLRYSGTICGSMICTK